LIGGGVGTNRVCRRDLAGGQPVAAFAFVLFGIVAFGYFILPLVGAGVSILFLDVSTSGTYTFEPSQKFHVACGTAWSAMFSKHNNDDLACAKAAYPRLWIAGYVAMVGMGVAFWGAGRRRLVRMMGYALLATGVARFFALTASTGFGGA
jgi:hypothetical protein